MVDFVVKVADSTFTNTLLTSGTAAYDGAAPTATVSTAVHDVVTAIFAFLGVIFFLLTVYAGILWMTAMGDSKKVQKAKDILGQSLIGLVICIFAWAFAFEVMTWAYVISN